MHCGWRHSALGLLLLWAQQCGARQRGLLHHDVHSPVVVAQQNHEAPRFAFVTLIANEGWVPGVLTLGCSLYDFAMKNNVDMLAMCYNFDEEQSPEIARVGWKCQTPELIKNPFDDHWKYDYMMKIHPFSMTQYERVVILDADTVVVNPSGLMDLFQLPLPEHNIMATPDCAVHYFPPNVANTLHPEATIQGGLIVLRPNAEKYHELIEFVPKVHSPEGGGQGFMGVVFEGNVTWLPAKFNYLRAAYCINAIDRQTGYYNFDAASVTASQGVSAQETQTRARADVGAGNVVITHYFFTPKPWLCDFRNIRGCGEPWVFGFTNVDVLYEAWLTVADACSRVR